MASQTPEAICTTNRRTARSRQDVHVGIHISGTRDASPYRDGTTAHTRAISLAPVMDRIREQIRQVRRQDQDAAERWRCRAPVAKRLR